MSVEKASGARVGRRVRLAAAPGGRIVLGPGAVVGAGCHVTAAAGAVVTVEGSLDAGCRLTAGVGAALTVAGALGEGCRVAAEAFVTVEAGARLGPECVLVDNDPVFADPERPVREQGTIAAPVVIGTGAELGPGVCVLRGVRVGAGARVLAHSVVTRDVAPGAAVAGTPARVTPV